jgi:hypothetical protein
VALIFSWLIAMSAWALATLVAARREVARTLSRSFRRHGASLGQLLHTLELRLRALGLRLHGSQTGAAGAQRGTVLGLCLFGIAQLRLGIGQLRLGLRDGRFIAAAIDAHQRLAGLDLLVILDQHLGHIAIDLRSQHGDGTTHIGIVRGHHRAVEGPQIPGPARAACLPGPPPA